MHKKTVLFAVLVALLWALCFPLITIGLSSSPPLYFAAIRALIAGLILVIFAHMLRRAPIISTIHWANIVLIGLTFTGIGYFGMFYGGGIISPGLATVIANTQPLFAAILAYIFLQESMSKTKIFGLLVGLGGILLISSGDIHPQEAINTFHGILFLLLGAIGVAVGNVLQKSLADKVDEWWAMGGQLLAGSIPLLLLAYLLEESSNIIWQTEFIVALLVLSVLSTAMASLIWFQLLKTTALSTLNAFTFLTPIFALFMGITLFNEQIGLIELAGILLCFSGIYLVIKKTSAKNSIL